MIRGLRQTFSREMTTTGLKTAIILWGAGMIVLAIVIDNPWILAGILAWEVLP